MFCMHQHQECRVVREFYIREDVRWLIKIAIVHVNTDFPICLMKNSEEEEQWCCLWWRIIKVVLGLRTCGHCCFLCEDGGTLKKLQCGRRWRTINCRSWACLLVARVVYVWRGFDKKLIKWGRNEKKSKEVILYRLYRCEGQQRQMKSKWKCLHKSWVWISVFLFVSKTHPKVIVNQWRKQRQERKRTNDMFCWWRHSGVSEEEDDIVLFQSTLLSKTKNCCCSCCLLFIFDVFWSCCIIGVQEAEICDNNNGWKVKWYWYGYFCCEFEEAEYFGDVEMLNTQVDSHKAFEVCGCYSRSLQCLCHFWIRILNDSVLSGLRES